MSAIGGVYNFDGAAADDEILITMGQGLESRGPDGGSEFKSGSIGMVYRAFHTNKESRLETQPLVSSRGDILCWDGRLDNRKELSSSLHRELLGDHTDLAIVMASYCKWGIDFLPRLIGDFALALWDKRSKTLILARDVIGSHDLYYQRNQSRIMWSTDLELLLNVAGVEPEVDEDYVAGYLARLPEPWQTPFRKIEVVPPAHTVIIKNELTQVRRYWGLNPHLKVRYNSDAEYEEHFRQLFRDAVGCCLRSDRPVWSDLSGGLDSSSVVCMADQLIKKGQAESPVLETVSCIRDESPSSNEERFIRYVEERIGKRGHHLPESKFPILDPFPFEPSIIPNPLDIFASSHRAINKLMLETGGRVRLCGSGGDEILNSLANPSAELTDLLVGGNLLQLHRRLCAWSRDRKKPYTKLFWQDALLPVLPRKAQVVMRHGPVKRLPNWLEPHFIKRTNLCELWLGPRDAFGFRLPSGRKQAVSFLCAVRDVSAGYVRLLQNVEIRLPMLHRPLVEFMQAIPNDQRVRLGATRSLQRRALSDLLPSEVLKRKGKGIPGEATARALCREYTKVHSLLSDSYVARYGYVNQQALMKAIERIRYGDKSAAHILRILPLEFWLRSLERRRSRTKIDAAVKGSPEARLTSGSSTACPAQPHPA